MILHVGSFNQSVWMDRFDCSADNFQIWSSCSICSQSHWSWNMLQCKTP